MGKMKLAMSLGDKKHYRVDEIAPRHFIQSAKQCGFGAGLVEKLLVSAYERVPEALDQTESELPDDFPQEMLVSIKKGIEGRRHFLGTALASMSG